MAQWIAWVLLAGLIATGAISPVFAAEIGVKEDLSGLTLLKTSAEKAVVRFGNGPLTMIAVGDRLGRNGAEVKEIVPGRVVLEEIFTGKDGRPNRAEIILKDGEKGGKRYVLRPEEEPPAAVRPEVVFPKKESSTGGKTPPKGSQNSGR